MVSYSFIDFIIGEQQPISEIPTYFKSNIAILEYIKAWNNSNISSTDKLSALEDLSDQIKLTVNQLITGMIKFMKVQDESLENKEKEFKEVVDKLLTIFDDHLVNITEISKEKFEEVKLRIGLKPDDYKLLISKIKQFIVLAKNIDKDVRVGSLKIASSGIQQVMDIFDDISITCTANPTNPSGYDIVRTDKFSKLVKDNVTLGELECKPGIVKNMKDDLVFFKKELTNYSIKKYIDTLHDVYGDICDDIAKLPKSEDLEKHVEQFEKLTIQVARIYFYYKALCEFYLYIYEIPMAYITEMFKKLSEVDASEAEPDELAGDDTTE